MIRPLIALTLAASIALTPMAAAPARADNNDNAAAIAALLGLIIVGTAVSNSNNDVVYERRSSRERIAPRRTRALPEQCLKRFETRRGTKRYFGSRCLERNFRFANRLPERCEIRIKTRNRAGDRVRRDVYTPACLRREGYFIAGRR
ncbi:hypothetical protein [Aliiroseovarius subalbicans]|uniref:hypothetical protein n=1 Tax=Aliiroseovarius subalbicans TaxID=2925840 RepID=UPI001F578132|nr:hypothetical protein [Aliiroseovarius subalbicans]MCI2400163.1 hypothetical protein [Aliiroseovarius subalbicans]